MEKKLKLIMTSAKLHMPLFKNNYQFASNCFFALIELATSDVYLVYTKLLVMFYRVTSYVEERKDSIMMMK